MFSFSYTLVAMAAVVVIAISSDRWNRRERRNVSLFDDDQVRQSVMFAREDLRLIALLLAGILVALGLIADRLG